MDIGSATSTVTASIKAATSSGKKSSDSAQVSSSYFDDTAAVYEKSSTDSVTNKTTDYSAIISQMKADQEAQANRLQQMVQETIAGQGNTLSKTDDIWKYLASGNYTVSAAAKQEAQEAISEDGYWGVDKTSSRIVDFAIALSGGDSSKAETYIEAFKKGYEEATSAWGKDLPDISSKTYDAVLDKFDQWVNGTYVSSAD